MRHQNGFTLLEVLIAMVIFAFGILGIAGLQMIALSGTHNASLRTMATVQAYDMADRMRANLAGVQAGNYTAVVPADNGCRAVHFNSTHAPGTCTPAQLAADDIDDWAKTVASIFPGGQGTVCVDSTPNDGVPGAPACDGLGPAYAVKVWWTDKPKNGSLVDRLVAIAFQP